MSDEGRPNIRTPSKGPRGRGFSTSRKKPEPVEPIGRSSQGIRVTERSLSSSSESSMSVGNRDDLDRIFSNLSLEPLLDLLTCAGDEDAEQEEIGLDKILPPSATARRPRQEVKVESVSPISDSPLLGGGEEAYFTPASEPEEGRSLIDRYEISLAQAITDGESRYARLIQLPERVPDIGNKKLRILWDRVLKALHFCHSHGLEEVMSVMTMRMQATPSKKDSFLECFEVMSGHVATFDQAIYSLEQRITALANVVGKLTRTSAAHLDETAKIAAQTSSVSSTLASLQHSIEATVVKVNKLDLLPPAMTYGPTISIPFTSGRRAKAMRDLTSGIHMRAGQWRKVT